MSNDGVSMPELSYILAVLGIAFMVTFALRALPFVALQPLRESKFLAQMSIWMPVGILVILSLATFGDAIATGRLLAGLIALVVTIGVHLGLGRRTLLSVGLGTLTFVLLVNL